MCYQHTPWLSHDAWEFTPHDRITHVCCCKVCELYKEHHLAADLLADEQGSYTWKACNNYEQDLVHLRWDLAHEGTIVVPLPNTNLMTLSAFNKELQCCSHELTTQLEDTHQVNKGLKEELECKHLDTSLRAREADFWQDKYQILQEKYTALED
jgi:hypothetical protein